MICMVSLLAYGQQVESKKCPSCGKLLKECGYKGKHPTEASVKPASERRPQQSQSASRHQSQSASQHQTPSTSSGIRMEDNTLRFSVDGHDYSYKMVYVAGGTYTMGCTSEQSGECYGSEKPAHSVSVGSFYMGQTEVTQALWKAVMGSNPSNWKGNNLPVEKVSWNECQEFIRKLNSLTGRTFRLPTEEEWEFAARGGNSSRGYKYSGSNSLGSVAWYDGNSGSKTHPVGQKQANELGIYDMSGNVLEWCSSQWCEGYSSARSSPCRVLRGGGWRGLSICCRVSYRSENSPDWHSSGYGLRLVMSAR